MKLSNLVIRICYMVALIYLCYITYQHIDILKDQFQKKLIENFQTDTGSSIANLLKTSVLSAFGVVDYSRLIDYSWGTTGTDSNREESKIDTSVQPGVARSINFNFINTEVELDSDKNRLPYQRPTGAINFNNVEEGNTVYTTVDNYFPYNVGNTLTIFYYNDGTHKSVSNEIETIEKDDNNFRVTMINEAEENQNNVYILRPKAELEVSKQLDAGDSEVTAIDSSDINWGAWEYNNLLNRYECTSNCYIATPAPVILPKTTNAPWCFNSTCATLDTADECDAATKSDDGSRICEWNSTKEYCTALPITCNTTSEP